MRPSISQADLLTIFREADVAAWRLLRQLRLSRDELDDVRQDLLLDLIARLPGFDPERGSLGAFAGVVMVNRGTRIARRVHDQRRMFGFVPVRLDELAPSGDGATRGDLIAEEDGLAAAQGYWVDPVSQVEQRLALQRGLGTLDRRGRRLAAALFRGSPSQLARAGLGSRSELYRQTRELRLTLLAAGVAAG